MAEINIKDLPGLNHAFPTYVRVAEFARRKNISQPPVYRAIRAGQIVPVLIGEDKDIFINVETYKDFEFPRQGRPKNSHQPV